MPHIGPTVRGDTVLGGPVGPLLCLGIPLLDLRTKLLPTAPLASGAVTSAPHQQQLSRPAKGETVVPVLHIHPVKHRSVLQCQDIASALIELERIEPVLV